MYEYVNGYVYANGYVNMYGNVNANGYEYVNVVSWEQTLVSLCLCASVFHSIGAGCTGKRLSKAFPQTLKFDIMSFNDWNGT